MKLVKLIAYGIAAVLLVFVARLLIAYSRTMNAPASQIDTIALRESTAAVMLGLYGLYALAAIVGVYLFIRFIKWSAR